MVPRRRKPDDPPLLPPLPWDEQAPAASTSAALITAKAARKRCQRPALMRPMRGTAIEFTDPAADHLGERRPEGVQYCPIVAQQDDCTIGSSYRLIEGVCYNSAMSSPDTAGMHTAATQASGTRTAGRAGQLAPLRIESTPSLVAARIRAGIFDRTFPPDGQLNEVELARDLGVSRGPVREAFQRLIHEGLLRAERNRGVFVVALDQDCMRDVYFVRDVIEQAAAQRAAERRDEVALGELAKIVESMKAG